MTDRTTGERSKRFLWRCRDCGQQFTVRVGTVFEDSRIPLRYWVHAFWRASASKKGVSALQISRETGLSYKSALFLMHRIRFAMSDEVPPRSLDGVVELDETYIGGKRPGRNRKGKRFTGRSLAKVPVMALVERDGNVQFRQLRRVTTKNLGRAAREYVHPSARVMTDDLWAYRSVGKKFARHDTIRHSRRQYVQGDVHTNTVEGVFSLLKRGLHGTFHSVSRKHLHRYLAEFQFRYNNRKVDDGERTSRAIRAAAGKRLRYRSD
jgi:transposase-like protein